MYYISAFLRPRGALPLRFHKILGIYSLNPQIKDKIGNIGTFSSSSDPPSTHLSPIRSNLSNLQEDLSFLTSTNIKSVFLKLSLYGDLQACQTLELTFKDPCNSPLNSKLSQISRRSGEIEKLVYRILNNRVKYNMAKNTSVAKSSNYKYGIVGVSLMCVFGSLSLSLHPLFLIGCGVGLYFYRVVYKQSMLRKVTNVNLENLIVENRTNKKRLSFLINLMLYRLNSLERDLTL